MTTTFLVPYFSKSDKGKVNRRIDVPSQHVLVKDTHSDVVPAISSQGFSVNRDGSYVFVAKIEKPGGFVTGGIGFTSTKSVNANTSYATPGYRGMCGLCLDLNDGKLYGGNGDDSDSWAKTYLPKKAYQNAKEVVAILTISNDQRSAQFIVNGNEGRTFKLAKCDFENENGGDEIFPFVTMYIRKQTVEMIPFNQVKSHSPRIEELMKQFADCQNNNNSYQKLPKKAQIKKTVKKMTSSKTNDTTKKKKAAAKKKKTAKKVTRPIKKAGKKIAKKK